jgi:hypothetical protein
LAIGFRLLPEAPERIITAGAKRGCSALIDRRAALK